MAQLLLLWLDCGFGCTLVQLGGLTEFADEVLDDELVDVKDLLAHLLGGVLDAVVGVCAVELGDVSDLGAVGLYAWWLESLALPCVAETGELFQHDAVLFGYLLTKWTALHFISSFYLTLYYLISFEFIYPILFKSIRNCFFYF